MIHSIRHRYSKDWLVAFAFVLCFMQFSSVIHAGEHGLSVTEFRCAIHLDNQTFGSSLSVQFKLEPSDFHSILIHVEPRLGFVKQIQTFSCNRDPPA